MVRHALVRRPHSFRRLNDTRRHAFTLVELLVVITIIGILMALLLPVLGRVREMAHRVSCMNNQTEIGKAMMLYATTYGRMPPQMNLVTDPLATTSTYTLGWAENLMSQLGRNDLSTGNGSVPISTLRSTGAYYALLVCPSDPNKVGATGAPLSYVVNGGCPNSTTASPVDWNANGAWNYTASSTAAQNTTISIEFIAKRDGTSSTISHSENLDATIYMYQGSGAAESSQSLLWYPNQTGGNPPINYGTGSTTGSITSTNTLSRPSSNHPGGAVVAFCDGSVKFLQQSMAYNVYASLMTSFGAQAAPPGSSYASSPSNSYNAAPAMQLIPLDSSQIPGF